MSLRLESIAVPAPSTPPKRRDVHLGDRVFFYFLRGMAISVLVLIGAIVLQLVNLSIPALRSLGLGFLTSTDWNPVEGAFGAASFIYGTIVSSLLALLIAVPVSVGAALFLNELSNDRLAKPLAFLIEMLAAIPSVVYGLWGIFVLSPWLRESVQPWLVSHFGYIPLFAGPPFGVGMLCAGIVLAIMITPTISAICREVFRAVPLSHREAALALGATRWEMIYVSVLRSSTPGMLGGIMLGLGRALGETMAVTMVIGNRAQISSSLFAPAQTMASIIANEYAEAQGDAHLSALAAIGLALFAVSLVINSIARLIVWRVARQGASR